MTVESCIWSEECGQRRLVKDSILLWHNAASLRSQFPRFERNILLHLRPRVAKLQVEDILQEISIRMLSWKGCCPKVTRFIGLDCWVPIAQGSWHWNLKLNLGHMTQKGKHNWQRKNTTHISTYYKWSVVKITHCWVPYCGLKGRITSTRWLTVAWMFHNPSLGLFVKMG